jgi:hypothetical protein
MHSVIASIAQELIVVSTTDTAAIADIAVGTAAGTTANTEAISSIAELVVVVG